jgi:hypothetical protein
LTPVLGYLVLAAIAAVLCCSRRGARLMQAAGAALAVVVGELRGESRPAVGELHAVAIGEWAAAQERENAAKVRRSAPRPTAKVIPFLASARWRAIASSRDERWVM